VPAAAKGDAAVAPPVTVADAGDKTPAPKDVAAAQAHALDVMHGVNNILDGDVPKFNKAHDLASAQKAYEQAIVLAKSLTPQDMAQAQKDLAQVRKDKATETDPTKQRDLANKEVDLYTITRLKDAALGNMALWYYRQGKTEDGNAKLLEASGIDPATAQQLKKMGPDETKAFANILSTAPAISPILGDVNFYRQVNKINQAGGQVPAIFSQVHELVLKHNADTAKAAGTDANAGAPGSDANAGAQPAAYDIAKNNADMAAFNTLNTALTDKPGPITADQRKTLEAGITAYDAQNSYVGKVMDASQAALDKLISPDKQKAFGDATTAINAQLDKLAVPTQVKQKDGTTATVPQIPTDLQTKISSVLGPKTPAESQAASADLAKTNPDLLKALQAAKALLPAGADGSMQAMLAYSQNQQLKQDFDKASAQQIFAHYSYAKILTGTKTPPDPADFAHAQDIFKSGFTNASPTVANALLHSDQVVALGTTLKLIDKTAPAAGAPATPGDKTGAAPGAPATPGDKTGAAPGADAGTPAAATGLAALSGPDLLKKLDAAQKQGPSGFNDAKGLFEEAIRRVEDPSTMQQYNDQLKANVTALEAGKTADNKPLDAAARMLLHTQDVQIIEGLSNGAQIRSQYAGYLGANRQDKSMDAQQRLAIASADKADPDLLKRADAQINKDRAANVGDPAALNQLKVTLEGGKDASNAVQPSLLNMRVALRDQLAFLYLKEGLQRNDDKSVTVKTDLKAADTDGSFKPQVALQLLTEARAAQATLNGADAKDGETEQLYNLGQALSPDVFKSQGQAMKSAGASAMSDVTAFFGAQGGRFVGALGIGLFDAATEDRFKINPMLAYGLTSGVGVVSGTVTRHFAQELISGQSESWTDSAIHGTAVTFAPDAFKAGAKYIPEGWSKITGGVFDRSAGITTEGVLGNVAKDIGPGATPSDVAAVFERAGLTREAGILNGMAGKPAGAVTAEDIAALNLNGIRGTEALARVAASKAQAVREIAIASHLGEGGAGRAAITNVGQLDAALTAEGSRVAGIQAQVKVLQDANQLGGNSSIRTALGKLTNGAGARVYSAAELDSQTALLKGYGINNVSDLSASASKFTMANAFPELASMPANSELAAAAKGGMVFGDANTVGRNLVENSVLKDAKLPPLAPVPKGGIIGMVKAPYDMYIKPLAVRNVDLPISVTRGAAAAVEDGAAPGGKFSNLFKGLKPEVQFHTPSFEMRDAYWNKLTASSSDNQFIQAAAQSKYMRAVSGGLGAFTLYNSTTGLYDKWYKGAQYTDAQGNDHKYTPFEALWSSNLKTPVEALGAGFMFQGALTPVLEEATPAAKGLGGLWSRYGTTATGVAAYGLDGLPNLQAGQDKMGIYGNTQRPLVDDTVDNGPVADQLPPAPPTVDNTGAPAPVADPTKTGQAADTTSPAQVNTDQPTPAAKPTPSPQSGPPANQSSVGGALAPPGS
jgi:hypothetical protein